MNRTFLAILIATIAALSVTFATTSISFADGSENAAGAEIPRGQLTKKGISGIVVTAGGGTIKVATRFGMVTVNVPSGTPIRSGSDNTLTLTDIKPDDRVGIQLNRSPVDPDAPPADPPPGDPPPGGGGSASSTDGGGSASSTIVILNETSSTTTDDTLPNEGDGSATSTDEGPIDKIKSRLNFDVNLDVRDISARKITVVPAAASTRHVRGLVTGKANGKFQLICGSGDTSSEDSASSDDSGGGTDDGSATSTASNLDEQDVDIDGEVDAEVGDEIILIADTNEDTGDGGCPTRAKGGQNSDRIAERLTRLAEKTAARDSRLADKIADLEAKRAERQEARNDKTRGKASPEGKGKIDGARGKPVGDDAVPRGGKPNDRGGGKPDTGGSSSSDRGGGKPDDKGGGKPEDKGGGPPDGKGSGKPDQLTVW